jgi:molybdopterin converting factor small subunit
MVMTKCTVDFFGLPATVTEQKVEIEVKERAKLGDIIAALRHKVPALEGKIIITGQDRMVDGFTFNIHGHFYVDGFDNDQDLQLQDGDHIALLTMPIGG